MCPICEYRGRLRHRGLTLSRRGRVCARLPRSGRRVRIADRPRSREPEGGACNEAAVAGLVGVPAIGQAHEMLRKLVGVFIVVGTIGGADQADLGARHGIRRVRWVRRPRDVVHGAGTALRKARVAVVAKWWRFAHQALEILRPFAELVARVVDRVEGGTAYARWGGHCGWQLCA